MAFSGYTLLAHLYNYGERYIENTSMIVCLRTTRAGFEYHFCVRLNTMYLNVCVCVSVCMSYMGDRL